MKNILFFLAFTGSSLSSCQTGTGIYPVVYTGTGTGQYSTISAAIAALPSTGGEVFINCGTYTDNITLASSYVRLTGAGVNCVLIKPLNTSNPLVQFHQAGSTPIQYDELSNVTLECTATCAGEGIKFYGDTANVQNDWHKISRVYILGGFQYGIEIVGRTIWSAFENIQVSGAQSHGIEINIPSTAAFNFNVFRDSRSASNGGAGVYFTSANTSQPPESNVWDRIDIENDAPDGTAPCAGFHSSGAGGGNMITGSYFENNCDGSSDPNASHVRLTGTYNEGWTISGNQFNDATTDWAIYNDTNWTGGVYSGNTLFGGSNSIYIATVNSNSSILLANNVLNSVSAPKIVPDANSISHVTSISSMGPTNALTGTRFVCIDIDGNLVSSKTACSGT